MLPPALSQRYRLIKSIGAGAMGSVLLAEDTELGRQVAIKLSLRPNSPAFLARFRTEARSLAQLHHPGIVQLYDHGVLDNEVYLVLEYVEGTTLAEATLKDPMGAMWEIADALEAVHKAGLVHRDVKPENILVTPEGRIIVIDFGLAFNPDETRQTATGALVGTPIHLAPELFQGGRPSPASDFYSWVTTLFMVLEGDRPFDQDSLSVWVTTGKRALPWRKTDPDDPRRSLVERCVTFDPESRPKSRRELEDALVLGAVPVAEDSQVATAIDTTSLSSNALTAKKPASTLRLGVAVGFALTSVLLALGLVGSTESPPEPPVTPALLPPSALLEPSENLVKAGTSLARLFKIDLEKGSSVGLSRIDADWGEVHHSSLSDPRFPVKVRRFHRAYQRWIEARLAVRTSGARVPRDSIRGPIDNQVVGQWLYPLAVWRRVRGRLDQTGLELFSANENSERQAGLIRQVKEMKDLEAIMVRDAEEAITSWEDAGETAPSDLIGVAAVLRGVQETRGSDAALLRTLNRLETEPPEGNRHLLAVAVELMLGNLIFQDAISCESREAAIARLGAYFRPPQEGFDERHRWYHRLWCLSGELQLARACLEGNTKRRDSRFRGYIDEAEARGHEAPQLVGYFLRQAELSMTETQILFSALPARLEPDLARIRQLRERFPSPAPSPGMVGP